MSVDRPHFKDIYSSTPQEVYQQVTADWQELTGLFERQDHSKPPDLALVYHKTRTYYTRTCPPGINQYYVRFQPKGIPAERRRMMLESTLIPENELEINWCDCEDNFIVLGAPPADYDGKEEFNQTKAHEVTHSVVFLKEGSNRDVSINELRGIRHRSWESKTMAQIVEDRGLTSVELDLNEFFPPLGEAHLLKEGYRQMSYGLVERIPILAAELLIGLYQRDISALVREHPRIAFLSSDDLWNKYCMPLLTGSFKV